MQLPGNISLQRFPVVRFLPLLFIAITINILVFFAIQLMVTGDYNRASRTVLTDVGNFIRLNRDVTPPDITEDNNEPIEPELEEDLPPPQMPAPQFAPPAPASPVSAPVARLDIDLNTPSTANLNSLLNVTRARPQAPKIALNLVPTVRVNPVYPQRALNNDIEGIVTVEFTVGTDGSVKDPKVVKARPEGYFEQAVLQVIGKWKFPLELANGQAIEYRARQDITFNFSD